MISSYPVIFSTDTLFSSLVYFAFFVFLFFFSFEIKYIHILIHLRLSKRVSNKRNFNQYFSENKTTFFWPYLSQKLSEPNIWLLVNHTKPADTLYWNEFLLITAGNYKSASGQLQKNILNGVMTIVINRVIKTKTI